MKSVITSLAILFATSGAFANQTMSCLLTSTQEGLAGQQPVIQSKPLAEQKAVQIISNLNGYKCIADAGYEKNGVPNVSLWLYLPDGSIIIPNAEQLQSHSELSVEITAGPSHVPLFCDCTIK